MLKKILINNAIALSVWGLSIVAAWGCYYALSRPIIPLIAIGCIAAFLYVLCGFFLMPVKKCSYLSVVSLPIAMVIALLICVSLDGEGLNYYLFNPVALALCFGLGFLEPLYTFFALLSPVYPSLLFYLGMVLKKRIVKRRASAGDGLPDVPGR